MPRMSQQQAQAQAFDTFARLGVDPASIGPEIIAQVLPLYMSDWNGSEQGNQAVETLVQQIKAERNSPEYKRKEAEGRAGDYAGSVNQIYQSMLGRDATDAEAKHFGTLLGSGELDTYTLGQFLQATPEYQNSADKKFRGELTGELQGQGERYFSEKILPAIQANFARSGRSVDSSGYAAALAQAAKDQNTQRETFLSNLTASQYGANKSAATADYSKLMDQYYGSQNYGRQRADYLTDAYTKRLQDMQDYETQRAAYDRYLKAYGKRSSSGSSWGSLGGTLGGAGLGALLAVPTGGMSVPAGAMLGAQLGGPSGTAIGSFF